MKSTPIYALAEMEELSVKMQMIRELLNKLERETAFLRTKEPMLYAVPAPDDDCISIGGVVVCGISSLEDEKKEKLVEFLSSLANY